MNFFVPEQVYYTDSAGTRGGFKVTNLGTSDTTLTITYLYPNGSVIYTKSDPLPTSATRNYIWQTEVYNSYGITDGSAIVSSTQKIAIIPYRAKNTGADMDYYKGASMNAAGTHVIAYGLKYMGNDSSTLTVSNMASSGSTITLRFLDKNGNQIMTTTESFAGRESKRYIWKTLIYDVYGVREGSVEITSGQQTAALISNDLSPQGRLGYISGEMI